MNLVAKTDLRYAGRDLKAGEVFEATEKDAFVLTKVGKAEEEHGDAAELAADRTGRRGNRYRRSDMRSED